MKNISIMGCLYRLTDANYQKVLQERINTGDWTHLENYRNLGRIHNVTDLDDSDVLHLLTEFRKESKDG